MYNQNFSKQYSSNKILFAESSKYYSSMLKSTIRTRKISRRGSCRRFEITIEYFQDVFSNEIEP